MRKFRHSRRLQGDLLSDINVTPFVDVLLILLEEEVFSLESLKLQLPLLAEWKNRDRPVYLQMDERVPYGFLIEMMILFKNAGFPRVGLVFRNQED